MSRKSFNRDQYEQLMLTLSTSQKKLLVALARERTDEFGDAYRRRHALGVSSTVNSAKAKLMEDGHVERYDGRYTIADPFLHSISAWREAMLEKPEENFRTRRRAEDEGLENPFYIRAIRFGEDVLQYGYENNLLRSGTDNDGVDAPRRGERQEDPP